MADTKTNGALVWLTQSGRIGFAFALPCEALPIFDRRGWNSLRHIGRGRDASTIIGVLPRTLLLAYCDVPVLSFMFTRGRASRHLFGLACGDVFCGDQWIHRLE